MLTIHVLDNGELFRQILNATSTFIYGNGFKSILKVAVLSGIIFSTLKYIRSRDPSVFASWFVIYMIVTSCVIAPKTEVQINDVSQQLKALKVENVPAVFAIGVKIATSIGFGLGQAFDMLMSMPDDMQYTKTGMLFGSNMMQAVNKARVEDSELKEELSGYFRNCVVGDVRLLHQYTLHELRSTTNIADTIFDKTSKLRRTILRDGQNVTCQEAAAKIKAALNNEIENQTFKSLWARLIGKQVVTTDPKKGGEPMPDPNYKELMGKYIQLGSEEFQGIRDEATNILRQTMLINAIDDGVRDYQAYTNSQSGLANYNFSKSQVQHRNAWLVMGKKAAWFLPLQHTILLLIMFGIFPILLALSVTPFGGKVFKEYAAFFLSLQLWPAIFAIINVGMTYYGKKHALPYGGISIANIDSVEQVHADIAGIAGYAMFFIPSIAYGLVSKGIGNAMMHNANSGNSHTQGSTMSVASEIAGGNISVGQSSYMNTNANNLSLNKHDSNWTDMHGMSSEQLSSGLIASQSANGQVYANASQALSHGAFSLTDTSGLQHSLSQASEKALQSANAYQMSLNDSITHAASQMVQYGNNLNHDARFGEGGSITQTSTESQAMSRIIGVANDVAKRTGISQSDALSGLSNIAVDAHAGLDSRRSLAGKVFGGLVGAHGGVTFKGGTGTSSNHTDNHHTGVDQVLSAKAFSDFKNDLQTVMSATTNSHFDSNHSQSENLINQIGSDLRSAQSAADNYSASLSESERISNASNYVSTHSDTLTHNLNQEAFKYGVRQTSKEHMYDLMGATGDPVKSRELEGIYQDFLDNKAQNLIKEHGDFLSEQGVLNHNKAGERSINAQANAIQNGYEQDASAINSHKAQFKDVSGDQSHLKGQVNSALNNNTESLQHQKQEASMQVKKIKEGASEKMQEGERLAKRDLTTGLRDSINKDFTNIKNQIPNLGDR
jgi:conjugal transfer mating pair stabilization protein TraG